MTNDLQSLCGKLLQYAGVGNEFQDRRMKAMEERIQLLGANGHAKCGLGGSYKVVGAH